jgi:hypothetical protein
MRKNIVLLGTIGLSLSIIAACSSDTTEKENPKPVEVEINNEEEQQDEVQVTEEKNTDTEASSSGNTNIADTSTGDFKDQPDLRIGDSGQAESTIGKYEITLKNIELQTELDGEKPLNSYLFVTDLDIKNIGENPINSKEIIKGLEITSNLDGGGFSDNSDFFKSLDVFAGEIAPGETVSGQAIFDGRESEKYYIRIKEGLVGSGAVKNQLIWNFSKSELE